MAMLFSSLRILFVTLIIVVAHCTYCIECEAAAQTCEEEDSGKRDTLKIAYKWKLLDFKFEREEERANAILSGAYIPANSVPFGVERWKNKLFVTVPRRLPGVPSTLNYIPLGPDADTASPLLIPYPDWESNRIMGMSEWQKEQEETERKQEVKEKKNEEKEGRREARRRRRGKVTRRSNDGNGNGNSVEASSSSKVVSTYRINVDTCDRLWIVDNGEVRDFQGNGVRLQRPAVKIFDLNTDLLVKVHEIRGKVAPCGAVFTNIVADVRSEACNLAFGYIADPARNGLVVYDLHNDASWRVEHSYFHINPFASNFHIAGYSFQWDDGVFGIALSSVRKNTGYRTLYFHPMASTHEFSISAKYLQNSTLSSSIRNSTQHVEIVGNRGTNGQASASSIDERDGVLFYTLVNKNGVGCWNGRRFPSEYSPATTDLVFSDNVTMIYSSDLKVDKSSNLWVLSNKLPIVLYGYLNPNKYNFHIFSAPVREVVKGSFCEPLRGFWTTNT